MGAQSQAKPGTSGPWTVPRTPDGRPDLQGMWTNATLTPLERPRALADRAFLTEQEAAALEAQAAGRQAGADDSAARQQAIARGDVGSYNQFWFDSGSTILPTRQTSLVVDPPDGRVPVRPEAEARRDDALKRSADHPEFMSMWDRCVSRGVPGWIIPAGYNNAYQIVQTPGYVVIHAEMIHDARIIPLDGRPPLPSTRAPAGGRLARPLGRRHAGGRDHQLQRPELDCDQRGVGPDERDPAEHGPEDRRALHAERRPTGSTTRRGSRTRKPSRGRGRWPSR